MRRLTAVLRNMNLYAELSDSPIANWRCHCFGRAKSESKMWLDAESIDVGNSHVTVTFKDREKVLESTDTPQWKKDHPCGGIWVDFSKNANSPHQIQITINLPPDVYKRVRETDLSHDDIIVTVGYDNLTPRGEDSANALLSTAVVHFHTRFGDEGEFGKELN